MHSHRELPIGTLRVLLASAALTLAAAGGAWAQAKGELVETRKIWHGAMDVTSADLVRFKGRWFAVCREGTNRYPIDGVIRVVTSADGVKWESAAILQSPAPETGLMLPRLSVTADNQLCVFAVGPLPHVSLQTMAWRSRDGVRWGKVTDDGGDANYLFGRVAWHRGMAYRYGAGCICGNAQTIRIEASKDGVLFETVYEHTFSGFFPHAASLAFDGDTAYCLMGRGEHASNRPGYLGTAKAPFNAWTWKDIEGRISRPNLLSLPDGRILAALGLHDRESRTSLCELNPATGKLTEIVRLPTGGVASDVGLALHEGHVWASYSAPSEGRSSAHLARMKLPAAPAGDDKAKGDEAEAAARKLQEEIARELGRLEGKWVVVARYHTGHKQSVLRETVAKQPDGKFRVVKVPQSFEFKGSAFNGTPFTMDVSRRPRLLTYETVNAVNEKVIRHFIYTFDDEHLLLAESGLDIYRGPPADFSGFIQLLRLERAK